MLHVRPASVPRYADNGALVCRGEGDACASSAVTPDDATWRGSRRRGLRNGAPLRPSRETRQQEALDLLRLGPVILWPHKHANPCGRIALRDLVKQGLVTMTIEDHLDLAAFARMEYTLRRCKVYRLKPTGDVEP